MPIDMGSIAAVTTSLQSAGEIMKAIIGLRDGAMIQSKVIELNAVILAAQNAALSANTSQFALSNRIRELEEEIIKMKAWDAEKQRYQLSDVGLGSLAYALKPEAQGTEPTHSICASCCNRQKKSILQPDCELGFQLLRCPECKDRLRVKEIPVVIA